MTRAQTILIVDDDPTIQLMTSTGLGKRGYQTQVASSVSAALEQMAKAPPDLVLASVHLSEQSGYALVRAVRSGEVGTAQQDKPILILTALDDVASIHQAFTDGATDFITKPVNLTLLAERVKFSLAAAERARALRDAQLEQASACRLARLGFWHFDIGTRTLQWSSEATDILECDQLPASLEELVARAPETDGYRLRAAFQSAMDDNQGVDLEVSLRLRNDRKSIMRFQSESKTQESSLIGAFQDVTALRDFENRARYLTEYDEATDLPRRRLFKSLLDERIEADPAVPWSISVIDISGMHRANALLGTRAGDEIVAGFAQRLKQALPATALIARLESDSFIAASPLAGTDRRRDTHEEWLTPVAHAQTIDNQEVFVDFTAGVSFYPDDERDIDSLIRNAQLAQQFGQTRRGRYRVMHYKHTEAPGDSGLLSLENDIRKALARREFFLAYQFQQQLITDRFTGAEALLRWRHPVHGVISPGRFIPMLEESGLIAEVGEWVIEEACRQLVIWHHRGVDLVMGVNISAQQFEQSDLADRITAIACRQGAPSESLKLEITESMAMQDPEAALQTLQTLRSAGFRLALDDFGTGHSSYEYLLRFPMDTIKIDRTFVTAIAENTRNRAVVRSLTSLARGLGLQTIAEGVETQRQKDYLDALDVDEIQGFLINRPMPPEECIGLFE